MVKFMHLALYIIIISGLILLGIIAGKNLKWFSYKKIFFLLFIILVGCSILLYFTMIKSNVKPKINPMGSIASVPTDFQSLEEYKTQKVFKVGIATDFYPWSYELHNKPSGFQVELIKNILEAMGKRAEFVVMPLEDLHSALAEKKIDIIANLEPITQRARVQGTVYSLKYSNLPAVFFGKKSINTNLENNTSLDILLSKMKNKKIVVRNNTPFFEYAKFVSANSNNVTTVNDSSLVFAKVESGGSNIGIVDLYSFTGYIKSHPEANLVAYKPVLGNQEYLGKGLAFILNPKKPELKTQLDIALSILVRKGVVSNLSIKYFGEDITS